MRHSSIIRDEIGSLPPSHQVTYRRAQALRKLVRERAVPLLFELTAHKGSERLDDPGDSEGYVFRLAETPTCQSVVGLTFMHQTLEASDEYKEAAALIEPLEAELADALAAEAEQARIVSELESKVAAALDAAEARAKEAIAKDSAVEKARKELEKAAGRLRTSSEIAAQEPKELTIAERYHGAGKIHTEPSNA